VTLATSNKRLTLLTARSALRLNSQRDGFFCLACGIGVLERIDRRYNTLAVPSKTVDHFQGHTFGRSAEAFAFAQTSR
jgi:hypothetical protein